MEISAVPKNIDLIGICDGIPLWNQSLLDDFALTEAPVIDREPHKLVILLGKLIGNPRVHLDAECFSEIMSNLGPLLIRHFTEEECLFTCSCCSDGEIVSHVEAHNVIIDQCTQISFDLMQGVVINRVDELRRVRRWIFEHIVNYDLKFKNNLL